MAEMECGNTLRRTLKIVIALLAIIIFAELVYHLLIAPQLRITEVKIEGETGFSTDELAPMVWAESELYYTNVDLSGIRERIGAIPSIRSVNVRKKFPNTLYLDLIAREPLAIGLVQTTEGTVPVSFDAEGVVFQIGKEVTNLELPVVSGLQFRELKRGLRLPPMVQEILSGLDDLRQVSPTLFDQVSELRVSPLNEHDYELLLYLMGYEVPARIERAPDERLGTWILTVLDALYNNRYLSDIREIDFRTGQAIYRLRERDNG